MPLSKNWITEKVIDFEYKKYILLAFLKEVNDHFDVNKLYPHLSQLIEHYKLVVAIKENKQSLLDTFPQKASKIDWENFKITYEKAVEDDVLMTEIENILDFSIPQFQHYLNEGKKIYDAIEEQIQISPVGLMPLNANQGYMFINDPQKTNVYEYQISIYEQPHVKYRGIHTQYLKSYSKNIGNTFEWIKTDLIRENKRLINPAAFAFESNNEIPLEETFLPVAKRSLVKYVSSIS